MQQIGTLRVAAKYGLLVICLALFVMLLMSSARTSEDGTSSATRQLLVEGRRSQLETSNMEREGQDFTPAEKPTSLEILVDTQPQLSAAVAESLAPTPVPVAPTPEPVATTPEPAAPTTEPAAATPAPMALTSAQPVATTVEPVSTTVEPVATTPGPVAPTSAEPVAPSPQPVGPSSGQPAGPPLEPVTLDTTAPTSSAALSASAALSTPQPPPPPTTIPVVTEEVVHVPVHEALLSCIYSKPPEAFRTNESYSRYEHWSDVPMAMQDGNGNMMPIEGGGGSCYNIRKNLDRARWKEAPMFNHSHRRWLQHAHDLALDNLVFVNATKVRRMFSKKQNETLIGHVFGGSFTLGRSPGGCNPAYIGVDCPFSNRIEIMLKQLMPDVHVTVRNHGKGGTNSKVGLGAITGILSAKNGEKPDFVILDFTVNDRNELAPTLPDKFEFAAIFEAQLSTIELYAPNAVIIFVMDELWAEDSAFEFMASMLQKVALHHRAGFVNFRSPCQMIGYCPFRDSAYHPSAGCERKYNEVHPSNPVHLAMGETLVDAFVRLYLTACEGVDPTVVFRAATNLHPKKEAYANCMVPTTQISAFSPPIGWSLETINQSSSGWMLTEDRPGKPGWITWTPNSSITFEVEISNRKPTMLAVTYLKSYAHVCPAELSNSVNNRVARLNPRWDRPFSVSFTQWYDASDKASQDSETGHFGLAIEPGSRFNVSLRLLFGGERGCKFKLISIVTC